MKYDDITFKIFGRADKITSVRSNDEYIYIKIQRPTDEVGLIIDWRLAEELAETINQERKDKEYIKNVKKMLDKSSEV